MRGETQGPLPLGEDVLRFFDGRLPALPLYEAFARQVEQQVGEADIRVKKTQISFFRGGLFACVSFLPVRRAAERPRHFITITFGLPWRVESPRIDSACQPSPNRWTHHVLIGRAEEIDGELMAWIGEAAVFAEAKKQKGRQA